MAPHGPGSRRRDRPGRLRAARCSSFLEERWREPDEGIWEVRGPRRHFTHSKVMAWVAFDRAVKAVEQFGLDGPGRALASARATRSTPRSARKGFDAEPQHLRRSTTAREELDASLLMIPLVGFLPGQRPSACVGTVEAIERELMRDGFVRALPDRPKTVDGLPPGEGAFLPCTFWLADNLALLGRHDEARALFERLLGAAQRRRPALRGIRPGRRAAAGQLPAGVLPRGAGQHGPQPSATTGGPAQRRGAR